MTDWPVFTAPQVVELINNLDYSRLDYWSRSKVLVPSVARSEGRGNKRLYSFIDVIILRVITKLRNEGVGLDKIREIVSYLRNHQDSLLNASEDLIFVTNGEDLSQLTTDYMDLLSIAAIYDLCWTMPIGLMVHGLKCLLKKGNKSNLNQEAG